MLYSSLNKVLFAAVSALVALAPVAAEAQETLPWNKSQPAYGSTPSPGPYAANDAYRPNSGYDANGYGGDDVYSPEEPYDHQYDSYRPAPNESSGPRYHQGYRDDGYDTPPAADPGYGAPYSPPPQGPEVYERDYGRAPPPPSGGGYEQNEIIGAGHKFFGSISQGLAGAVEYAFKSQGRPNGYILGEDAGGAFVLGLRYGEGTLYTKDAGHHKVFWQGPSVGYDAGAEGSKTMVLVYNLRDPSEIYARFGGVQGAAYLVGGVSVQFQKYGDVTLAVIRSGVGVRLGANIGYLKYTRTPTWNPL